MAKTYNSKATIGRILSVSAGLFLEKGFEKTSMQDIAEAAGLSKGAIYHHFNSKEDIIQAVARCQAQANQSLLETWLSDTAALKGKDALTAILEKNLDCQETHSLDGVLRGQMKSAEFVLSYMQNCVDRDARRIADIIRRGVADGSLVTAFPEECAEVFLLLLNVWCDPAVFRCQGPQLTRRLRFLQHLMTALGVNIFSDALLEKTVRLLQQLYGETP